MRCVPIVRKGTFELHIAVCSLEPREQNWSYFKKKEKNPTQPFAGIYEVMYTEEDRQHFPLSVSYAAQ